MISEFELFPFDSFVLDFHLLKLFFGILLFVNDILFFSGEVELLLFQGLYFFGIEFDELPVFDEFGVAMGDFFIEDDIVFGEGSFLCFGICSYFVGCLQSVVESFIDFLEIREKLHRRGFWTSFRGALVF